MDELSKINNVITDYHTFLDGFIIRDGYVFTDGYEERGVYNRIIIRKPEFARIDERRMGYTSRTFEEHIEMINKYKLEKAYIMCDELDFILKCPTLNDFVIFPSLEAKEKFDYSPLYKMPKVKKLYCKTKYGVCEQYSTSIDYSKITGLENLVVENKGHIGYENITTLKILNLRNDKKINDLHVLSCLTKLEEVRYFECGLKSLNGISMHKNLKVLSLWHNYSLTDISELEEISSTLKYLDIDACSKIKDFSVLSKLENLEVLSLEGNNVLPNLDFLENMKKLKFFIFTMNVEDGNLNNCMKIPYVNCRNRRHFNLKNDDLPKEHDGKGFPTHL